MKLLKTLRQHRPKIVILAVLALAILFVYYGFTTMKSGKSEETDDHEGHKTTDYDNRTSVEDTVPARHPYHDNIEDNVQDDIEPDVELFWPVGNNEMVCLQNEKCARRPGYKLNTVRKGTFEYPYKDSFYPQEGNKLLGSPYCSDAERILDFEN